MQNKNNQHSLGWLQSGLSNLCSGTGDISQAAEALAGRAPVSTNAPGVAGQGGDIGSSQGPIA